MRLGAGCGVLVHDARLGGLVHGGDIGLGCSLGCFLVGAGDGCGEFLAESLDAGLGRLVTRGEASGLTGGFDGGLGISHGSGCVGLSKGLEPQSGPPESRAISGIHRPTLALVSFKPTIKSPEYTG